MPHENVLLRLKNQNYVNQIVPVNCSQLFLLSNPDYLQGPQVFDNYLQNNIHPNYNYVVVPKESMLKAQNNQYASDSIKYSQSKFKNMYGLIVGRVIRSCREYLKLDQNWLLAHNGKHPLAYIHNKVSEMKEKDQFENYLASFHNKNKGTTRNRGKNITKSFLKEGKEFGLLLLDLVLDFLDENNRDFQIYLSDEPGNKKNIVTFFGDNENLHQLRFKFLEMKDEIIRNRKILTLKEEELL